MESSDIIERTISYPPVFGLLSVRASSNLLMKSTRAQASGLSHEITGQHESGLQPAMPDSDNSSGLVGNSHQRLACGGLANLLPFLLLTLVAAPISAQSLPSGPLAGKAGLEWQAHPFNHVAASPDGQHVAVASSPMVVVWKLNPNGPVRALLDTRNEDTPTSIVNIAGLEFNSDGRLLVVRTRRGTVRDPFTNLMWIDVATGEMRGREQTIQGAEHGHTVSSDGKQLVAWSSAGTTIIDRDNGHSVPPIFEITLPKHGHPPDSKGIRNGYRIYPLPDKQHGLLIRSDSYQVIELATVAPIREFSACSMDRFCGAPHVPHAIGDGSRFIAAAGFTFGVGLWDVASGQLLKRIEPFKGFAEASAISARKDRLAINNDLAGSRIAIIKTESLDIERVVDVGDRVGSLAFMRGGSHLLAAGGRNAGSSILSLWDVLSVSRVWSVARK